MVLILQGLLATFEPMVAQEMLGSVDSATDVTGVSGIQVMLALQVEPHVVGFVGGVLTDGAAQPAVPTFGGIAPHYAS